MTQTKVIWRGDMHFKAESPSGYTLTLDASEQVGGQGMGFRPMELLLIGLAGCTAMDVISILKKKRQDVTGFEVHVRAERADTHPRIYTDIHVEYIVRGREIKPEAVARAIELSETKYCSAQAMLGKSAHITHSYRIEPPEGEP